MVAIEHLLDDYYFFDEQQYRLVGKETGRIFTLGQKVRVTVLSTDKLRKTIDFVLEEFSEDAGWDVHGSRYAADEETAEPAAPDTEDEILFDDTEEEWYSDDEEGYITSKDDIAKNDWLDDEETNRLLNLYAGKNIREI